MTIQAVDLERDEMAEALHPVWGLFTSEQEDFSSLRKLLTSCGQGVNDSG